MSTLPHSVDFAPPQPILGFQLGNIHLENLREYRSATLRKWHQSWRALAFSTATANSTPNGVRTFSFRPTRADSISAPGLSMSEPNARMPRDAFMIGPIFLPLPPISFGGAKTTVTNHESVCVPRISKVIGTSLLVEATKLA